MFWCSHKWVEVQRTLTPGVKFDSGNLEYRGPSGNLESVIENIIEEAHEHTIVLLKCDKCGDIKSRTIRGDFTV